jgi:hypothetical protein
MSDEYKKIENSKTEGDFVLQGQTLAKKEGFSNVSKIWYDKTMSYDKLRDELELEKREQHDILLPIEKVEPINADGGVYLNLDGELYSPTEHAYNQLATNCFLTRTVIQELQNNKLRTNGNIHFRRDNQDRDTLVTVLKNGLRRVDKSKVFRFRTYKDGTLRAMLTTQFQPIQNDWYLDRLEELIPDGRVSHWKGNADEFYGNILMPDSVRDDKDSGYGGMISGGNSEIGTRAFDQSPSLFRAICMNGCIWGQEHGLALRYVHKKSHVDLGELREQIKENIHKQIPLIPTIIAKFVSTKDMKMESGDKMKNIVAQLGVDYKLQAGAPGKGHGWMILDEHKTYESYDKNLFGLINSVTRAAQNKELSKEEWYRFDSIGGDLMNYTPKKWESLRTRAKLMDDKVMEKFYCLAS